MAHLAVAGSHAVNGVAALHTELLRRDVFRDFDEMRPAKFSNKTNGVTPRRWLHQCNPRLSAAHHRGDRRRLADGPRRAPASSRALADDAAFVEKVLRRQARRTRPTSRSIASSTTSCGFDPDSLFDVQIKRLHEYKRQLLERAPRRRLYLDAKRDPERSRDAAHGPLRREGGAGLRAAKLIIKLINAIADVVNGDTDSAVGSRSAFMPNYRVSLAERIIPAADLSGADLDRRQRGLRHRQHEARDERRAHDRHARRRQHRDPRRRRRGQLLPLRPDDRGGARSSSGPVIARGRSTRRTSASAR